MSFFPPSSSTSSSTSSSSSGGARVSRENSLPFEIVDLKPKRREELIRGINKNRPAEGQPRHIDVMMKKYVQEMQQSTEKNASKAKKSSNSNT